MSRPQAPHRPLFPFGNPFKMMLPKGSKLSPKLCSLLNTFEEMLVERLKKLKPKQKEDVLSLSWMGLAMECLCEIHTEIKAFITALELPISDWDDKWIDVYLDGSVKLLDICIAFSSELSRLSQGHLFLQCVLHNIDCTQSKQFTKACSSLDGWRQHISSNNPRLENCFSVLDQLSQTLDLPKVKNSDKGKVLMQAMYGVKVITVFICSIFAAAFSGSSRKLMDTQVNETTYLWAEAFLDLQAYMNNEVRTILSNGRFTVMKELESVEISVKNLYPMIQNGVNNSEAGKFQTSASEFRNKAEKLSQGLDFLMKEVDNFFQIVLTGRDALLCNLREGGSIYDTIREDNHNNNNVERPTVR